MRNYLNKPISKTSKQALLGSAIVASLCISSHVHAEEPVKFVSEIGAEYNFQFFHTDDGLRNKDGSNQLEAQSEESDFATIAAKLSAKGKLSDTISWFALYQVDTNPRVDPNDRLERFWLANKVSENFDLTVGIQKIKVYGWHRKLSSSASYPIRSTYLNANPLKDKLSIDGTYKLGDTGTVSLSLVKDYYDNSDACARPAANTAPVCQSWNTGDVQKQPAFVLDWSGKFGLVQPLLQYAVYDKSHSNIASAGLRLANETIDTYIDYSLDTRNVRALNVEGTEFQDHENRYQGITIYGEVFLGTYTPYYFLSNFDYDQYRAPNAPEIKTNTNGTQNDNSTALAIGSFYEGFGKFYRPYAGLVVTNGKYVDPKSTAATPDEETRTKTDVVLGLSGKF